MNQDITNFLDLLWEMSIKELKARYKHTIFGLFWLIVNPLLQMIVIGFVFRFFMKSSIPNYNYYLFLGLLMWNFFSTSLTKTVSSIVSERSLIKKAKFSHAVIPLSIILSNFIQLIAAFVLFIIPVIFLNTLNTWSLPTTLLAFILLLAFTGGISLLLSALNVRFRDVNFFVQAILIVWFYATPIIYSINIIPFEFIWLWRLNPMVSILQLFQSGILSFPMPESAILTLNIIIIVVVLIAGISIFKRESNFFDDWL